MWARWCCNSRWAGCRTAPTGARPGAHWSRSTTPAPWPPCTLAPMYLIASPVAAEWAQELAIEADQEQEASKAD